MPVLEQLLNVNELYSAPQEFQIDELREFQEMPESIYIRKSSANLTEAELSEKIEGLTFWNGDPDVKPIVRINEPLVYYVNQDGNRVLIEGHSRRRAILMMLADSKYSGYDFKPFQAKRLLIENPTPDTLQKLQVTYNDTTLRHKPIQLAHAAMETWENRYQEAIASGSNQKQAKGAATAAVRYIYGITDAYISKFRTTVNEMPEALQEHVNSDFLNLNLALDIMTMAEKSKVDPLYIFSVVRSQMPSSATKMLPQHLKACENLFKPVKDAEQETGIDGAEAAEDLEDPENQAATPKADKMAEFSRDKALETVEKSLVVLSELPIDAQTVRTHPDLAAKVLSRSVGVISSLANLKTGTVKAIPVEVYEPLKAKLEDLISFLVYEANLLDGLGDEELYSVQNAFTALDKEQGVLFEVVNSDAARAEEVTEDEQTTEEIAE